MNKPTCTIFDTFFWQNSSIYLVPLLKLITCSFSMALFFNIKVHSQYYCKCTCMYLKLGIFSSPSHNCCTCCFLFKESSCFVAGNFFIDFCLLPLVLLLLWSFRKSFYWNFWILCNKLFMHCLMSLQFIVVIFYFYYWLIKYENANSN